MNKRIYFYGAAILLLIISFFLDNSIAAFFVENKIPFFDGIAIFIHNFEGYGLFLLVLVLLFVFGQKKMIVPFLLTFIFYLGATQALKIIIARPRPFTAFSYSDLGGAEASRSFPSGHATATASVLKFFEFNKIIFWIWVAVMALVAFSRVYIGAHYASDVIAGIILGFAVSELSIFLIKRYRIDEFF